MTSKRKRNVALWALVIGLGVVGLLVLFISASYDWDIPPIENPGTLIGGAIAALAAVLGAVLPAILRAEEAASSAEANTAVIKAEVKNSHASNLRDNIDTNHGEVTEKLEHAHERIGRLEVAFEKGMTDLAGDVKHAIELIMANASDTRGVRRDIGRMTGVQNSNVRRIGRIERALDTLPLDEVRQFMRSALDAAETGSIPIHQLDAEARESPEEEPRDE